MDPSSTQTKETEWSKRLHTTFLYDQNHKIREECHLHTTNIIGFKTFVSSKIAPHAWGIKHQTINKLSVYFFKLSKFLLTLNKYLIEDTVSATTMECLLISPLNYIRNIHFF